MTPISPLRFHAVQELTATIVSAHTWTVATPPRSALQAVVIIPVKDEAKGLPRALAALAAQTDLAGRPFPPDTFEVIVLANNCRDQTAAVARRFAAAHPQLVLHIAELTLPPAEANVGRARRLLMDEACRRLELLPHAAGLILSTDGDTEVASTWLAANQAELQHYCADAIGGRILTPGVSSHPAERRYHLRDTAYRLLRARLEYLVDPSLADPWPRHHQHFGASFAITARAYRRVGGLPVVAYLEDEALYQLLCRHDLRVRHSPAVRVFTSDRKQGRVEVGLSWQLRQWAALHRQRREPQLESAAQLIVIWQNRRQLRMLWQLASLQILPAQARADAATRLLADKLGIAPAVLARQLRHTTTFGQLWEWVQHEPGYQNRSCCWPLVPVSQAVQGLRQAVSRYEQAAA